MATAVVCRNCGVQESVELTRDEKDLITVGMLERRCTSCARGTRWGLAHDARRKERRRSEQRRVEQQITQERRRKARRAQERRERN